MDIFKSRILISRISKYFPDYEGDFGDYNAAKEYFKLRFTKLNRSQNKEICTFLRLDQWAAANECVDRYKLYHCNRYESHSGRHGLRSRVSLFPCSPLISELIRTLRAVSSSPGISQISSCRVIVRHILGVVDKFCASIISFAFSVTYYYSIGPFYQSDARCEAED